MRFGVLGPVTLWDEAGRAVDIPGVKVRAALAMLLVHRGKVVSADRMVDALWGDHAPAAAEAALRSKISQLRHALGRAGFDGRAVLAWRPPGYMLDVPADLVDAERFAATADLGLWRGEAYGEFRDHRFAAAAAAELSERWMAATETRARQRLAAGEAAALAGELAALARRHPLREGLHAVWMRALYRSGRQSEALAVHAELAARLRDELGIHPGPEVAAAQADILAQREPDAAGAPPVPDPLTDLVGREESLRLVRKRLDEHRLVTLAGPGGVGKTRLALEAARASGDLAPDGAWFVDLSVLPGGSDAEAVMAAAAAQLGVRDDPASAAAPTAVFGLAARLGSFLRGRRALLVLDNCEHLREAAAAVSRQLLTWAPQLRILATSRESLRSPGEALLMLEPLPAPGPEAPFEAFDLDRYSAMRLFLDRAAAAGSRVEPTPEQMSLAATICRRLDGLPLALELAAARVPALGLTALAQRLDDRFRLLRTNPADAPDRHSTLEAVIAWSWDMLSAAERRLLGRLALAPGGYTLTAAEQCCGETGLDVLDVLPRLVEQSLVTVTHTPDGPRYRMLETVAAFARDRLDEAGDTAAAADRHAAHFLALAQAQNSALRGSGQHEALRVLRAESANLLAALRHTAAIGDGEAALAGAEHLVWFWILTGRLTEATRCLDTAIAIAAPGPARTIAETWSAALTTRLDPNRLPLPPASGGCAGWFLAFTAVTRGHPAAEPPEPQSEDDWMRAARDLTRALRHLSADEYPAAAAMAERSRAAFTALGDVWGVLQTIDVLSRASDTTGARDRAAALDAEALRSAEELDLTSELSRILSRMGRRSLAGADFATAEAHFLRARDLAAEQCDGAVYAEAEAGLRAVDARSPALESVPDGEPECRTVATEPSCPA